MVFFNFVFVTFALLRRKTVKNVDSMSPREQNIGCCEDRYDLRRSSRCLFCLFPPDFYFHFAFTSVSRISLSRLSRYYARNQKASIPKYQLTDSSRVCTHAFIEFTVSRVRLLIYLFIYHVCNIQV